MNTLVEVTEFFRKHKDVVAHGKFYVVTVPVSGSSTLQDVCFESSVHELLNQFVGGLLTREVFGLYLDNDVAEKVAGKLIQIKENPHVIA